MPKAALVGPDLRGTALIRLFACAPTRRRHGKLSWRAQSRAHAASKAVKAGNTPCQPIMRSDACCRARPVALSMATSAYVQREKGSEWRARRVINGRHSRRPRCGSQRV